MTPDRSAISNQAARDARFIVGVVALIIGMGVLASGLYGLHHAAEITDAAVLGMRTLPSDHNRTLSFSGAETRPLAYVPDEASRAGRLDEPSSRNEPVGVDRSVMAIATARWTASWYRAVSNDEAGVYLVSPSAARWAIRWRSDVMSWDDTSGYGDVERIRAGVPMQAPSVAIVTCAGFSRVPSPLIPPEWRRSPELATPRPHCQ